MPTCDRCHTDTREMIDDTAQLERRAVQSSSARFSGAIPQGRIVGEHTFPSEHLRCGLARLPLRALQIGGVYCPGCRLVSLVSSKVAPRLRRYVPLAAGVASGADPYTRHQHSAATTEYRARVECIGHVLSAVEGRWSAIPRCPQCCRSVPHVSESGAPGITDGSGNRERRVRTTEDGELFEFSLTWEGRFAFAFWKFLRMRPPANSSFMGGGLFWAWLGRLWR